PGWDLRQGPLPGAREDVPAQARAALSQGMVNLPFRPNLDHEEYARLHGGLLSPERVDEVLEAFHALPDVEAIDTKIHEARGCFPAEDFLSEVISLAGTLKARSRGANKDFADRLFAMLEDVAQCTFNAADYGRAELNDA